ncbi:MAG TPA: hypothetical protein VMW16_00295 [Sedimentisphaerales bacterium]|nr:hypothetical protein [Sedimentisphaerales bacterium]
MNQNQGKPDNLLDTTDCLEAVGVFRGWKNSLFIIVILCLLLLQVLFWVVDLGLVGAETETATPAKADVPALADKTAKPVESIGTIRVELPDDVNRIQKAAEQVAADSNLPAEEAEKKPDLLPAIKFKHVRWLIRLLDFVLIPAAILYCLTMLFCLKVSLLGRLGGINHISRAFFLSLLFLVLLLPWQLFFGAAIKGAMYTPRELVIWLNWYPAEESAIFPAVLYYLRFTGYWLLVMLLLILSQVRSVKWAKAILRRLEII